MTVLLFRLETLKTNCTIPNKKFLLSVHYDATDDNSESFFYLLTVLSSINLRLIKKKLLPKN